MLEDGERDQQDAQMKWWETRREAFRRKESRELTLCRIETNLFVT